MSRVIGYVRVSTQKQGSDGLGMEAQRVAITTYAKNIKNVVFFSDVASGAAPIEKRPGLMSAIDQIKKGDSLVVAKRDRLGRDVVLVAMIERLVIRKGGKVISVAGEGTGDGPSDHLMKTLVDAFAAYERQLISARTKTAMAVAKSQGRRVGAIPYGYKLAADGKTLVENPDEKRAIALIHLLKKDRMSNSEIGRELTRRGYIPRGKEWYSQTVANILKAA